VTLGVHRRSAAGHDVFGRLFSDGGKRYGTQPESQGPFAGRP